MTGSANPADGPAGEFELLTSRLIPATPVEVWAAISSAERIERWWGPKTFRNTVEVFDFRPGGRWQLTMHAPDGTAIPNTFEFLEAVSSERVVLEHISGHGFRATLTLREQDGGTLVTWRHRFPSAADFEVYAPYAGAGNPENLERLEAEVLSGQRSARARQQG